MRLTRLLPADSRNYYRSYVRENFLAFRDEADAERVRKLREHARQSAAWVLAKVSDSAMATAVAALTPASNSPLFAVCSTD